MKKRIIPFLLVVCLLISACPILAVAADSPPTVYYENYTAIGDSICAGFSQPDYNYDAVWDVTLGINNSPALCYASVAGDALGSNVFNLGKCGSDSIDLLDILTDESNEYYDLYRQYIGSSDLITLEIGSNDLLFSAIRSVLGCINPAYGELSNTEIMAVAAPFFTGEAVLTGDFEELLGILRSMIGTELTDDQIAAIAVALSDEALTATLTTAYNTYCANFQQIIPALRAINPTAELVILNYFNPYPDVNFSFGQLNYNIGSVLQGFTDQMNAFALSYCRSNGYVYVDISDTQTTPGDAHPSAAGHASIAYKIVDALLSTVTAAAESGGSINPGGDIIVKRHDSCTFTLSPDSGYMINAVYLDGVQVDGSTLTALTGGEYSYTLSDITEDHAVTVKFLLTPSYILSVSPATADFGSPTEGYTAPTAQDVTITNDGNTALTLTAPTSSHYTFTLGDTELDPGESTTLSVQPKTDLVYAGYDETVSINGSNGASTSVDLKFTVNESYKQTTKIEVSDGISVDGLMKHDVQLVVSPLSLGSDAGSNTIRIMQGSDSFDFIAGWNLDLTGDYTGSFTVKLPVDAKYNGQTVTILHAADSGLKTYSAVVVNGFVTITVTEFSPFAMFIKAADNSPGTGDTSSNFLWLLLAGGSILGAATVTVVVKYRRKED